MCLQSDGHRCEWQPYWPDGKRFAAFLTHDIDMVHKWNWRGVAGEVKGWGKLVIEQCKPIAAIQRAIKVPASIVGTSDPYWNFDDIMHMEEVHGLRSTFFFMAGGAHRLDGKYSIHTDQMGGLFAEILERGHEIGLHGSFDSYNNLEMLAAEKEALEAVVGAIRGIRQHYLRFDLQSTGVIHEKLNFAYDTTLGFAEHEGFRAGFCLPFRPYHIEEDRPFDLLEIPLTIMDGTFSNTRYRGLNPEEAWQSVESLFSTVKRCGGCIALLWHNSHLDEFGHADYIDIYTRALKWIVENNGMTI